MENATDEVLRVGAMNEIQKKLFVFLNQYLKPVHNIIVGIQKMMD